MQGSHFQINNTIPVDRLFVINKDGIVMTDVAPAGHKNFVGTNVSSINWIQEMTMSHQPIFSTGYAALDGNYKIAISYPIVNIETKQYLGMIGVSALMLTYTITSV